MTPNHINEIAARVADKDKQSVREQRLNTAIGILTYAYLISVAIVIVWLVTR